ncbi:putative Ankyrin repeat-containing domain protein [Seiridium cardinale]|uniref:Ankyrin repeat-containing domain protein n=1 Tax=Seiridium cardinale TaxID=138064 RepID=A0ABR2XFQ4_9PEZI
MSFGFGAGDFIAIIKLAHKVRRDFAGAPDQFQQITADLTAKYESCHERAKRVWERLQWEPNEVRDLRSRITSHIMMLNSHIMSQVRDNVAKIVELQDQQQNIAILNWLTPIDPDTKQSFFIRQRQVGTGEWLIDSPGYTNWKATRGEAIFCHGIPGAGLLSEIMHSIVEAVDGMFLLAKLHLDSLINKRSPRTLQKTLTILAAGSNAYTKAYQSTMERILGRSEDQKEVAIQTLMWVIYVRKPLTTTELQHALNIKIDIPKFLEDNIPDLQYIVSTCHGLLTVAQGSNIIRLAHYTTQEFFKRQKFRYFPDEQTKITDTCLTYLSFSEFDSGPFQQEQDLEIKLACFALYKYSSYHRGHRAKCQKEFESVKCFLDQPHHVEASGQVLLVDHSQNSSSKQRPTKVTAFHLVAYFGLSAVVKATTLKREDTDVQDSHCRTPLSYAAANGHDGVVRILLDWNAQLDVPDTDGQTPLLWATRNGHGAIVRLLLDGNAQVDVSDTRYGQIPPSWAIRYGQTPLLWAIKDGRDAIVRMLLDKKAHFNVADAQCRTPLSWAGDQGHEAIVHLFFTRMPV